MSFLPLSVNKQRYQYSKIRFLEREHGIEYLPFELRQMKDFNKARKEKLVEITGYVSWSKPPNFLLLPSRTAPHGYIICEAENELKYPALNQFVTVIGKWKYTILNRKPEKVLLIDEIHQSNPDFGKIKPHISSKEFVENLFEKWQNIRESTQKLIAQSMVSSPTMINERSGGLTLTLANYSKKNSLRNFTSDLRRFIPKEFAKNKSLSYNIPELGIKNYLPKLGWSDHVFSFEHIPKLIDSKLERIPSNDDEYSITLLENTMGPLKYETRGLAKSDYPIVFEEYVEKRYNDYDVSTDVFKYLLAVHMLAPVVPLEVYEKSIEHNREEITKFIGEHETFARLSGHDQFMDLGKRGKPLSIHNLAVSIGRGDASKAISIEDVIKTSKFYFENLENVCTIQEDWVYDKIPPAATMTLEERRVYIFFAEHPASTVSDVAQKITLPNKDLQKTIKSLFFKHLLYEVRDETYSAVPIDI